MSDDLWIYLKNSQNKDWNKCMQCSLQLEKIWKHFINVISTFFAYYGTSSKLIEPNPNLKPPLPPNKHPPLKTKLEISISNLSLTLSLKSLHNVLEKKAIPLMVTQCQTRRTAMIPMSSMRMTKRIRGKLTYCDALFVLPGERTRMWEERYEINVTVIVSVAQSFGFNNKAVWGKFEISRPLLEWTRPRISAHPFRWNLKIVSRCLFKEIHN